MNKIIIFGFAHCGTTILRNIIGHIDDVHDIIDETRIIDKIHDKKYTLCKYPFIINLLDPIYDDYIKIFIIRNPLYVFTSINKRFEFNREEYHTVEHYIETIIKFNKYRSENIKNMYTIRYEDIFENNFENLKNILDSIGFNYTDKIFDNSNYKNYSHSDLPIAIDMPSPIEHNLYRNWQVNQPFKNMNDPAKIDLLEDQKIAILNSCDILAVYPEIKDMI